MKIAIVGATGLVGTAMMKVFEERKYIQNIDNIEFLLVASAKSAGKELMFNGRKYKVIGLEEAVASHPQIAVFSAGASTSKEWAPRFAENGTWVIDNSSAWRMDENIALVIPEINASAISPRHKIIANPNCSTAQRVMVLAPLHRKYKIKRLVVSTYQSVTGTGVKAVQQMENERMGITGEMAYPYSIDLNLFPHGGAFLPNGYTMEEIKLATETRKILSDDTIRVTSTVVRVPVKGGHSEAVNIEFENDFDVTEVRNLLENTQGVVVQDDPSSNLYPMPKYTEGKDEVFVGRIRRDISNPNTLDLWIVADNLRKGAATNAIQIAAYLINKKWI
jgi:aspartate-semialdehyde dehydrogenase